MRPRRIFVALNCLVMATACAVLVPAFVLADVPASYTSYAYASGVHSIAGTSAFPNFDNGAINNHYPLAQAQQDSSPSSEGISTYVDSGPLAATAGSQYNQGCANSNPNQPPPSQVCQNPNNQVPYATAKSPGGPGHAHIDSCNNAGDSCPGARADADAADLSADSSAFYAGGGTQPFNGAAGSTQTLVTSSGNLTVITHSEVDSFGVGNVKVSKLVVDVNATSTQSSSSGDAHVTGGQVTVNGQPVSVTDQGVTVQDKQVVPCSAAPKPPPGPSIPSPPPPPPLPLPIGGGSSGGSSSSGSSGSSSSGGCVPVVDVTYIKLWTVAPTKTVDGSHITIWATGLHILVTHPTPGPGVPQQTTEYVLGEGFVDANAGAGGGFGGNFGGFGGGGFGGGFGGFGGGGDQSGAGVGTPGGALGSAVTTALEANRVPLAFMFLTLEALLLASAAAWVWARSTPAERVPEEVLSP